MYILEIKKHKHLINYLIKLDCIRNENHITLKAAKTFFRLKEYAWAIQEIKNAMNLPYKIKVLSDCRLENGGNIAIPFPFPGGQNLSNYKFEISINPKILSDFNFFVTVVSHELSHLLLYSIKHECAPSEKATDITSIIIGFAPFIKKGRKQIEHNSFGFAESETTSGYLSDDEFNFIFDCYVNNRKFRRKVG